MATFSNSNVQTTNELVTYTIDYTQDIPTGGSLSAAAATHTPPSGTASNLVCTIGSPYAYVEFPPTSVTGIHYVDVLGTISDGDLPNVRIAIEVVYPTPTARSGMLDIITELRALTDSGPNDYTIAGVPYWSDKQLQDVLDRHYTGFTFEEMEPVPTRSTTSITMEWYTYALPGYGWIEKTTGGTAIFYIQDANGAQIAAAEYSVDYVNGFVTFEDNQQGAVRYATGYSYDINAAAGEIWRKKAAQLARIAYNFSTDNHRLDREQIYKHCIEQAKYFESIGLYATGPVDFSRTDTE